MEPGDEQQTSVAQQARQDRTAHTTRWVRSANLAVAMLAVLAVVVDAAARLPGTALLNPVARGIFDLSAAPQRRLPALRQEFVRSELGRGAASAGLVSPGARRDAPPPSGGQPGPPREGPTTTTTRGALAPVVAPGDWELKVTMTADRKTAQAGDDIVYAITVRNVGRAMFRSTDFQLQWHVPFGTTSAQQPLPCFVPPLPDLSAICGLLEIPLPGAPEQYGSHVTAHYPNASIGPGGSLVRLVRATVTTAAPGSRLSNHAHFRVTGSGVTGQSSTVVVAVEAPVDPGTGP